MLYAAQLRGPIGGHFYIYIYHFIMSKISRDKARRTCIRTDITKTHNKLLDSPDSFSLDDCKAQLLRLTDIQTDLKLLDDNLFDEVVTIGDENLIAAEYSASEGYRAKLFLCISKLGDMVHPPAAVANAAEPNVSIREHGSNNRLKLPQIPLPTYSHKDGEDLHKFFLNLENILEKYNLSDYETFIFLQGQLSGEPLNLVKSLDIGSQSYTAAKNLLTRAFASVITQQFETIKRLSELKFTPKTPYEYIGKLRQIQEAFRTLKINTDVIMQYWFWNSMPETLQNQFVTITNSNRPNIAQIDQYVFEAMERYLEVSKNAKKRDVSVEVDSYAVNMGQYKRNENQSKQFCSLCSTFENKVNTHSTFNCSVYPSTEDKLNRLRKINGCCKCGNVSHAAATCRFKFKKSCMHCNKFHFSFLCPGNSNAKDFDRNDGKAKYVPPKNYPNKSKGIKKSVEAKCTWVNEITFDNTGHDSILPTFTFNIQGKTIRAMRDSGCQSSFISSKLAKDLRLKTVKNEFELGINGINSSRKIMTTVVEMPIFENEPAISLVCMPEIRTSLNLPGLHDVVESFVNRGYKLADSLLLHSGDTIANIDVIIGDNEAQVLPQTDRTFGLPPSSMYAETPFGILLFGGIERMQSNLQYLTYNVDKPSHLDSVCLSTCTGNLTVACTVATAKSHADPPQYDVIGADGKVDESILQQALASVMKYQVDNVLPYDVNQYEEDIVEIDQELVDHVVRGTTRDAEGRLVMPLMWDAAVVDRLANNFAISKAILRSNHQKLRKSPEKLEMYDDVIKDQLSKGIVRRVDDIASYVRDHPTCSFLPHMGIFRMTHDSTKCRVVYLSNLADRKYDKKAISHNQAIRSGPCLNKKIATAICDLRFDKYLLCFDIVKAFLNIGLYPADQERLVFLWYRNVSKGDFTIVAYENTRLPFGIRCSPTILSIAMHIMLIADAQNDNERLCNLKQLIYSLMYVDNGGVTANTLEDISWAYEQLSQIFNPYQFYLQQFSTNGLSLQSSIDAAAEETPGTVKLLGLQWNRKNDTISTQPMHLNLKAVTKREILSSIASNYDVFQFNGPILNRARIYMHHLQCDNSINWDTVLDEKLLREWRNICKQVNGSPVIEVPRSMGKRNATYNLIACTDASKTMFGVVLYLQDTTDNSMSFLTAKNRIVSKQLETKTIPCLEFHAIALGVELLHEYVEELSGSKTVTPINIASLKLLSDSMVSLHWLQAALKLDKMQKISPFVKNRLAKITRLCEKRPVDFSFISGCRNPADCISRSLSYKQLMKSNYFTGPDLAENNDLSGLQFSIPDGGEITCSVNVAAVVEIPMEDIPFQKYSTFAKLFNVYKCVFQFINKLKSKVNARKNKALKLDSMRTIQKKTWNLLLKADQKSNYVELLEYFQADKAYPKKAIPALMTQLNLFLDKEGIIRVKSKFDRWTDHVKHEFPVLLAKNSHLTALIINKIHANKGHAGCYSVLNELRQQFYLPSHFSVVRKILRTCIHCRRVNSRPIKISQNAYREFRISPPNIPFRYVFIDHFGPYIVNENGKKVKVWILLLSCLWSRAINLKMCTSLNVSDFLKCMQLHIFEFGTPELVLSDQGSQIVAGGHVITNLLNDHVVTTFLAENGIKSTTFSQYAKGCHDLGGLVESCVKISKRMIHGCMGKQVLSISDFQFIVCKAVCLVNKRPIAFRETLREKGLEEIPTPITPESLLRGHDLATLHILPSQSVDVDPDWSPDTDREAHIKTSFYKLNKNRENLAEIYRNEYIAELTRQATNFKQKYVPVSHDKLDIGDLVLLKEVNTKCINFPMGIVQNVTSNSLGEVTDVVVRKGNREIVKRHVKSLILLLKNQQSVTNTAGEPNARIKVPTDVGAQAVKPKRAAAIRCKDRMTSLAKQNLL